MANVEAIAQTADRAAVLFAAGAQVATSTSLLFVLAAVAGIVGPMLMERGARQIPGGQLLLEGRVASAVIRTDEVQWLKKVYELSGLPKPDGSLWHAFRRMWATARKDLPVKDVAAAGGWKDIMALKECYQQPKAETLRSVVEYQKPLPVSVSVELRA